MGSAEIHNNTLSIHSHIVTYGDAADPSITELIRDEIETMWNEPEAGIHIKSAFFQVQFRITAHCTPHLSPVIIYENTNPANNYFRIEEFAQGNISFVDGLGSNSGYFKLDNLYKGSTTAAHEYGHTLGLKHPNDLDYRGKGIPGIMYPRGTLVDPPYQYNPAGQAGDSNNGGTMHPKFRKVRKEDIHLLKLDRLRFSRNQATIGEFTNMWHPNHRSLPPGFIPQPGILG